MPGQAGSVGYSCVGYLQGIGATGNACVGTHAVPNIGSNGRAGSGIDSRERAGGAIAGWNAGKGGRRYSDVTLGAGCPAPKLPMPSTR